MRRSTTIVLLLCSALLLGQVPYGYLYCTAMRRPIDTSMGITCLKKLAPPEAAAVSSAAGMRFVQLAKGTTDNGDHHFTIRTVVHHHSFTAPLLPTAEPSGCGGPAEPPPPDDLVVVHRTLRI